jgi:hypothetical protein
MGPLWSQDQWRWIARELDLDVAREVDAASIAAIVKVIGGRAVDAPHAGLAAAAAALADAAAVDLLRACFDRCDRLIGADYWVALEDRGVREAVLERIGA